MSFELSAERSRQAVLDYTRQLADSAAAAGREAPVPTCPGWTVANLVEHVGQTQHWVSEIIERRVTDPTQLPTEMAELPADPATWPAWLAESAARVAAACTDEALAAAVFNAAGDDRTGARFWLDSMVNEAVVHGADAAAAAGHEPEVAADVAAALITNHLTMLMSPTWAAQRPESSTAIRGTGETLRWEATDVGSWRVERHPDGARQESADGAADVTVQGPARSLLFALTRRLPLTDKTITITGDADLAEHWVEHTAHVAG